ncbi:MAG: hypothetical protein JWM17_2663, partial [Actinobacteria bacterium]|nr:hypothetical protein [Actinomycetota bacterium]
GLGDLAAGAMEAAGPLAGALRWRFVEQFERVAAWQGRRLGHAPSGPSGRRPLGRGRQWRAASSPMKSWTASPSTSSKSPVVGVPGRFMSIWRAIGLSRSWARSRRMRWRIPRAGELPASTLATAFRSACSWRNGLPQASRALRRGFLFAFDYGDLEPSLWLRQPRGSSRPPGASARTRRKDACCTVAIARSERWRRRPATPCMSRRPAETTCGCISTGCRPVRLRQEMGVVATGRVRHWLTFAAMSSPCCCACRPRHRKKRFRAGNGERTAPEAPASQVRDRTSIFPSCTRVS